MMQHDRIRVEEDLRGQLAGEIHCDPLFVQLYASDASVYEISPLGVVRPRNSADVEATVRYAVENQITLHARGAGSGLAGESLGKGLIVDYSRYMSRIVEEWDDGVVHVQAGVVLDQLNHSLARHGRVAGPDPANSAVTTVGSMAAIDASGSRRLIYGSTRDHVVEIEAVLACGKAVRLSTHEFPTQAPERDDDPVGFLAHGVGELINRYDAEIKRHGIRTAPNRCGYRLDDVRRGNQIDLARLMVGSEGTLALFSSLLLKTCLLPAKVGMALFLFDSLDNAANAASLLVNCESAPRACDLMDRRHLSLAREEDPRYELLIPQSIEAVLLVEYAADDAEPLQEVLGKAVDVLTGRNGLAAGSHLAVDAYDRELLQGLARRFVPTLYRLRGTTRPIPLIEDVAVPPAALPEFLRRAQNVLNDQQV
ncbi:FAD-binding oxidoreductase, partial [Pirellulales bacterium]|nr:FAD-binding oxidoreductase [Pirellulales bacterium]